MNSRLVLSIFLIFSLIVFLPHPASAGAIDTSIEVVSRGIEQFMEYRTEKNLQESYGVTFGNTSEAEDITPAQKVVYMIAVANQNPYEVKWVRDQLAADLVWFSIAVTFISIYTFVLSMLQKHMPVTVESINKKFIGHNDIHDYTVWLETLMKLVGLAILALPIIFEILEFEQNISSELTLNAFEFLKVTPAAPNVYYWESLAYGFCAKFFLFRIEYIDLFAAHAFKIIIMFCVAVLYSEYIAKILTAWFLSAVFMRPIVLWYSNVAIKDIANAYPQTDSMIGNVVATFDMKNIAAVDMSIVLFASAITVIIALLWPVIMAVIEIVCNCLIRVILRALQLSGILKYLKGL